MRLDFDVTVLGSGPAGLACALGLVRAGKSVKVLTRTHRPHRPPELLAPATLRLLRDIGVRVTANGTWARACPKSAVAWSGEQPEIFDYELFMREPGMCVDRFEFDAAMLDTAKAGGVHVHEQNLHELQRVDTGWRVATSQENWTSRWLIDASGRLGATPLSRGRRHFDRLVAIYVPWKSASESSWLRLHATESGWWYAMPGANGTTHAVFMTDADQVPARREQRAEWLNAAFVQAASLRDSVSATPDFARHRATDARTSVACDFAADGQLLVGDAAWSNDPLSGRGIALALEQARQAVFALTARSENRPAQDVVLQYAGWCDTESRLADRARLNTYAAAAGRFKHHPFWLRRLPATEVSRAATRDRADLMAA